MMRNDFIAQIPSDQTDISQKKKRASPILVLLKDLVLSWTIQAHFSVDL